MNVNYEQLKELKLKLFGFSVPVALAMKIGAWAIIGACVLCIVLAYLDRGTWAWITCAIGVLIALVIALALLTA